jgi:DNA-binding YbaB/EbfC family protein
MSMFDALKGLGGMGGLGGLMQKAREMQDKMKAMQEELARKQVTADAGGGMVQATVNGRMELVKLKIDKSKIDTSDTEMLEDVIVAAVHGAQAKAAEMMKSEMQKAAGEMGLPPGLLPEI